MSVLLDLSIAWSSFHVLVLFIFLYESRYPKKKTVLLTILVMLPLALFNIWIFITKGPVAAGQLLVYHCTIPSLVFFLFMAKHRDGRFFFTFCLADTISYEILVLSRLLSHWLPWDENLSMFLIRLLAFPLLELFAWKHLRKLYHELQQTVKRGWMGFALISALFYLLLVYMSIFPTLIIYRPDDIPSVILVMILMPFMYWNILRVLQHQQALFVTERERALFHVQSLQLEQQMRQVAMADERMRIERHDRRHHIQSLWTLLEERDLEGAKTLLSSIDHTLESKPVTQQLCSDPILNATLTVYFQQTREEGITLHTSLFIPRDLPVDSTELSIVFANALENAIHACQQLPQEERWLRFTFLSRPRPMFEISNSCRGPVSMDQNGHPTSLRDGHGFGTRSITAFCQRNDAFATYETTEDSFCLRILLG